MTGDGINDALALKHASLGIAMGNAAPATKAVSRLVLLDGKFSSLPAALEQGRQVITNIESGGRTCFLTKTGFAILLGVLFSLFGLTFPFLPRQYSTADFLIVGASSFRVDSVAEFAPLCAGLLAPRAELHGSELDYCGCDAVGGDIHGSRHGC